MFIVLAGLLTLGVAIAISPLAIVAVILIATGGKGRTNGTAFILGSYLFAVALVGTLVLLGRGARAEVEGSESNILIDVVELIMGIGLLVMAVLQWRKRNETGTPKWMTGLDNMTIWKAFLIGVLISGPLSPKDLPLLIAAGGRIAQAELDVQSTIAVVLIFCAIGVVAVAVPWLISVFFPGSVEQRLSGLRTWLVANHAVIMTVLFLILGFKLIGSATVDLLIAGEA